MKFKYVLKEFLTSEAAYQNNLKELLYLLVVGQQQLINLKNESQSKFSFNKTQKLQQQTELAESIHSLNEIIDNIKPLVIINQDFDKQLTQKILALSASSEEEELFVERLKFSYEKGHFAKFMPWTTQLAVNHEKYRLLIEKIFPLHTAGMIKSYLITPAQRFPRAKLLVERMVENAQASAKIQLQNLTNSLNSQIAVIEDAVNRDQDLGKSVEKNTVKPKVAKSKFNIFNTNVASLMKIFNEPLKFKRL